MDLPSLVFACLVVSQIGADASKGPAIVQPSEGKAGSPAASAPGSLPGFAAPSRATEGSILKQLDGLGTGGSLPRSSPAAAAAAGDAAGQRMGASGAAIPDPRRSASDLFDAGSLNPKAATVPPRAAAPAAAAPSSASGANASLPSPGAGSRIATAEVVAAVLSTPPAGALLGRPLTLAEGLASANDRTRQLQVVRAYWRLAGALGVYRAHYQAAEELRRLTPRPAEIAPLRTAQNAAMVALEESRKIASGSQQELAEVAVLSANLPLPLPADLPHVGPYRTNFDEVYAMRNVSPRARLLHRMLPLGHQAIDARAQAVVTADDAFQALLDAYASGQADLSAVLASLTELTEQRLALATDVVEYNDRIAEYALAVVSTPMSGPSLVPLLIKTAADSRAAPGRASGAMAPASQPGVPATFLQSAPAANLEFVPPQVLGQPTPAPPRQLPPAAPDMPRLVPRYDTQTAPAPSEPTPASPQSSQSPAARVVQRMQADATGSIGGLYPALANATAPMRAKQLSEALHWNPALGGSNAQPIELREFLRGVAAADRRAALDAYWIAAERVAVCQVLVQQNEMLGQLAPVALDQGGRAAGGMLLLRARAWPVMPTWPVPRRGCWKPNSISRGARAGPWTRPGWFPPQRRTPAL